MKRDPAYWQRLRHCLGRIDGLGGAHRPSLAAGAGTIREQTMAVAGGDEFHIAIASINVLERNQEMDAVQQGEMAKIGLVMVSRHLRAILGAL